MVNSKNGPRASTRFDGWFRYPAGFSTGTLDACFSQIRGDHVVVDPFAGVATVGSRCLAEGHGFIGIEAHPLIASFGNLKLKPLARPDRLVACAERVANAPSMPIEGEHELVRRTFPEPALGELVGMREAIKGMDGRAAAMLELALLAILRDHAQVKVGWPYQLPARPRQPVSKAPRRRFLEKVTQIAADLACLPEGYASVSRGDARTAAGWRRARDKGPTALISSPPYLNNFDYADATRLELYFSGRAGSWKEMCDTVRAGMVVASTQQALSDDARAARAQLTQLPTFCRLLDPLVDRLSSERRGRGQRWGKQYDWLAVLYFRDLSRVLKHVRATLPPGAPLAWVVGDSAPYGVHIDTPALLSELGRELGFSINEDRVLRRRGLRWQTNGSRHQVPLTERLLLWAAPG
jgi:hypothetical protein